MSSISNPDRSPAASSRSKSALNLVGGTWVEGRGNTNRDICNPADTAEVLAPVREAAPEQVDDACGAAARAFPGWRAVPAPDRAHVLFKFRDLLEKNASDLAHSIVRENGKLLSKAHGSLRRGMDVVEFACGIPSQMMGQKLTDISRDVDCHAIREPLGVVVGIPPFNFPALIPLWMMSVAVACGNTFLLKSAEKAPLTGTRLIELFSEAGLPPGVVGVVQGSQEVSERLTTNRHVQAVSFVGTSAVAESVYRTAAAHGKRVQAHGGAKNHLIVLPDADLERSLPVLIESCFGSAGQRCLAGSVLVAVGDRVQQDAVVDAFICSAGELKLGDGLDDTVTLCPVVNPKEEKRIRAAIERGVTEGARLRLDGRSQTVPRRPRGCFLGPTVFDDVAPEMFVGREEIFGPVVSVMRAPDLDAAITLTNRSRYGNTVSLFTQSGAAARIFRERIQVGMLGINLGVPAPMAFFPFGGWKSSFYGDLNAQGADAVTFYTRKKVISERWFGAEAPKGGWIYRSGETMVESDSLRYTKIALNDGSGAIPALGFGTLIPDPVATRTATRAALEAGFRQLDASERYRNEKEVGEAMQEVFKAGTIRREDVFIATKLWNNNHRPERVKPAFEASLKKLQLDYVDLYLIHTPFAFQPGDEQDPRDANGNVIYDKGVTLLDTWRALEGLVGEGRCKAIGLSDVDLAQTKEILEAGRIKPAVVHVESHPYLPQWDLLGYCRKNGIVLQAFAALGHSSEPRLLEDPVIAAIARRVNKTPAQVLLAWAIQRGTALLTTSKTPSRIKENFEVSTLPEEAVREINEGIKLRVRFNTVVETGVPGFIPREKGG